MQTKQGLVSEAILTAIAFGLVAFVVSPAFAQTDDYGTRTTSGTYCPQLSQTVVRGSSGNQVLELQKFLSDYYDIPPTTIQTGYFGRITQGYVIQFQKEQGLPSYGIAGSMTRAAIAKVCGGLNVINDFTSNPTSGAAPLTVGFGFTTNSREAFRVDFGDGEIGNAYSACDEVSYTEYCLTHRYTQHTYKIPGMYTAKLIKLPPCNDVIMNAVPSSGATNVQVSSSAMCSGEGGISLGSVTITVTSAGTQSVNFTASNTSGGSPLTVYFSVNIGNADPHTFYIDAGNGQKLYFFGFPQCSSGTCTGLVIYTYTYSSIGTYTAKLMRAVPVQGENLGEVVITVTAGPNVEKITKTVGDKEDSFLIQKINQNSVEGLWYMKWPVPMNEGTPKTLYVGDDIGYACEGVTEKLTGIDYYGQKVTFTKIVGNPPMGGCPICLSGSAKIETPNGAIEVKNISAGMSVWTQGSDGKRHKAIVLEAGRTAVSPEHIMVDLKLSDGRELIVSPGHPLADGRLVGNLQVGDVVQDARVISTNHIANTSGYTYDILPSGDTGEYWADGILLRSTLHTR